MMLNKLSLDFLKDPRKNAIVTAFAVSAILLAYYNILFKGQFAQARKLVPQIRELRQKVQAAESDIANLQNYQKRYDQMKMRVDEYKKKLPYEKEIPGLLEHLSKTAKDTGVKILAIEPLNPDVKAKQEAAARGNLFLEMPIKIDARSGYHQLGLFINKLENSERFIKVTDIKIDGDSSTPRVHDVGLVISTFVLLQELKI